MLVLVALDSGEAAESVVRILGPWAVDAKAEVHLLTVLQPSHLHGTEAGGDPTPALTPAATTSGGLLHTAEPYHRRAESRSQAITRAHTELDDSHRDLASRFLPGVDFHSHVEAEENIASAILRVAAAIGADLVAMGTHGRSGLSHLLMGSVAEHVIRNAPVPVLVVGPKTVFPGG